MEFIPLAAGAFGLGSSIFGKPGSGAAGGQSGTQRSTSQQQSAPVDLTLPWFQQLGQGLAGQLGNFAAAGPQSGNIYGGPLTASLRPNEIGQLGELNALAQDPIRQKLIADTMSGQFLPGAPGGNPFLGAAISAAQRPTMEALQHAVGRQIPGMFAAAGQQVGQGVSQGGSTAKDLNVIRASEVGGRALGDIATNMSNQAYQFERGMQQGAVGLGQQDIAAMIANMQAQGLPRTIEDMGIQRAIALGQQATGNWLQGLQIAGSLPLQATGNVMTGSSQSAGTSSSSPGILNGLFGNAGLFGGLANAYGQNSIFGTAPRFGIA